MDRLDRNFERLARTHDYHAVIGAGRESWASHRPRRGIKSEPRGYRSDDLLPSEIDGVVDVRVVLEVKAVLDKRAGPRINRGDRRNIDNQVVGLAHYGVDDGVGCPLRQPGGKLR